MNVKTEYKESFIPQQMIYYTVSRWFEPLLNNSVFYH